MIFPLSDEEQADIKPGWVTISLIAVNVMLFLYQLANPAFTAGWSAVPLEISKNVDLIGDQLLQTSQGPALVPHADGPAPIHITLLSSMFMHGGWMHLGGNMLYLWIFGDNIEHRFGRMRFLMFYLLSGIAGALAHIFLAPQSIIPMVGASGAISGVLGAYLVLFPWNKVNAIFFYRLVSVPALLAIGAWAGMQFFMGWSSLANMGSSGGTAYAAHIGGFVVGALMGLLGRMLLKNEPPSAFRRFNELHPTSKRMW